MFQGSDSRMDASSTGQSRGQKMMSYIKSNVPDSSTDEDKHPKGTRQREVMNI